MLKLRFQINSERYCALSKNFFLASSSELQNERKQVQTFIDNLNNSWVKKAAAIELVNWEDFLTCGFGKVRFICLWNDGDDRLGGTAHM